MKHRNLFPSLYFDLINRNVVFSYKFIIKIIIKIIIIIRILLYFHRDYYFLSQERRTMISIDFPTSSTNLCFILSTFNWLNYIYIRKYQKCQKLSANFKFSWKKKLSLTLINSKYFPQTWFFCFDSMNFVKCCSFRNHIYLVLKKLT